MTTDMTLPSPFATEHPFAALALLVLMFAVAAAVIWLLRAPVPHRRRRRIAELQLVEDRLETLPVSREWERSYLEERRDDLVDEIERLESNSSRYYQRIRLEELPAWEYEGWHFDGRYFSSPSIGKCCLVEWRGEGRPRVPARRA